jgi:hypothetical protein
LTGAKPIKKSVMFLEMFRFLPIIVFLISCSYTDENYEWFSGNWVSDTEATLEANRNAGVSEEYIEAFEPIYGKLRWQVVGRTITAIHGDGFEHSSTFKLDRITETILDFGGAELHITETGFCYYPPGEAPQGPNGEIQSRIECFAPAET